MKTDNRNCYGLNYVAPKSYVEVPTPNEIVFGDRTYQELIKVNAVPKGGDLNP